MFWPYSEDFITISLKQFGTNSDAEVSNVDNIILCTMYIRDYFKDVTWMKLSMRGNLLVYEIL